MWEGLTNALREACICRAKRLGTLGAAAGIPVVCAPYHQSAELQAAWCEGHEEAVKKELGEIEPLPYHAN